LMGASGSVVQQTHVSEKSDSKPSVRSIIHGLSAHHLNGANRKNNTLTHTSSEESQLFTVTVTEISKGLLIISASSSYEVGLRISYESLDILDKETSKPYVQFPYQVILCWGCSSTVFQYKVFPSALDPTTKERDAVCIVVQTSQGKQIESLIMSTVKVLMADMEKTAVSNSDFNTLKECIFDNNKNLMVR